MAESQPRVFYKEEEHASFVSLGDGSFLKVPDSGKPPSIVPGLPEGAKESTKEDDSDGRISVPARIIIGTVCLVLSQ